MLFQVLLFILFVQEHQHPLNKLYLNTPEKWRSEVIPFPLGFAPEIKLKGAEVLRFAPGMFEADAEDFYTYSFIWWIDEPTTFTESSLEKDLLLYYEGLYRAVSKKETKDVSSFKMKVSKGKADGWLVGADQHFEGSIHWIDAFRTEKPITMNMRIATWKTDGGKQVALFLICPQERDHALWKTMEDLRIKDMPAAKS